VFDFGHPTQLSGLNICALNSLASCNGQVAEQLGVPGIRSTQKSTTTPLQEAAPPIVDTSAERNSVQHVFDAYRIAVASKNYDAMYSTISPAYQDGMIFQAVFALGSGASGDEADAIMKGAFDEKKFKKLQAAIAKDHPLTDQDAIDLYGQSVINRKKFITESWTYLKGRSRRNKPPEYANLTRLKIENNVASGKVKCTTTSHGPINASGSSVETKRTSEIDLYFIKSKGKWVVAPKSEWNQLKKARDSSVLTRPKLVEPRLKVAEANDLADKFAKQKVSDFRIEDYPDRAASFDPITSPIHGRPLLDNNKR